jgi:hypothetical protein
MWFLTYLLDSSQSFSGFVFTKPYNHSRRWRFFINRYIFYCVTLIRYSSLDWYWTLALCPLWRLKRLSGGLPGESHWVNILFLTFSFASLIRDLLFLRRSSSLDKEYLEAISSFAFKESLYPRDLLNGAYLLLIALSSVVPFFIVITESSLYWCCKLSLDGTLGYLKSS